MEEFRCEDTIYQLNTLSPQSNKTVCCDRSKNKTDAAPPSDIKTYPGNKRSEYSVIEKQVHKLIDIAKNIPSQNYSTNIEKVQCMKHQMGEFIYYGVSFKTFYE